MLILIFYTVMLLRQLTEIDSTKQDRKKKMAGKGKEAKNRKIKYSKKVKNKNNLECMVFYVVNGS